MQDFFARVCREEANKIEPAIVSMQGMRKNRMIKLGEFAQFCGAACVFSATFTFRVLGIGSD